MTARIVLTIAVFTLHEIDMFAELQLIKDPRIEDQVLARYDETLKSLRAEGFERLGVFETRHGPSLGPAALFFANVGNEVWRYDAPWHVNWYHPLLQSAERDAVVYPMGLGVKIYSFFDDGSTLMTSNCPATSGWMKNQNIEKRYLPGKSTGETWLYHLAGCEQKFAEGRVVIRGDLVDPFLDVQLREDEPYALLIAVVAGWLVPPAVAWGAVHLLIRWLG